MNSFATPWARNGLCRNRCETAGFTASGGVRLDAASILMSAFASGVASPRRWAPDASACASRERETAIWIMTAAIGAKMIESSAPRPPPSRSFRPPPPKIAPNMATRASIMIPAATVAATAPIRMSWLRTWDSSCARTPASSSSFRTCRMPSVTATAAWFSSRPVANALGCGAGITYSRGIGIPDFCVSSRTIR